MECCIGREIFERIFLIHNYSDYEYFLDSCADFSVSEDIGRMYLEKYCKKKLYRLEYYNQGKNYFIGVVKSAWENQRRLVYSVNYCYRDALLCEFEAYTNLVPVFYKSYLKKKEHFVQLFYNRDINFNEKQMEICHWVVNSCFFFKTNVEIVKFNIEKDNKVYFIQEQEKGRIKIGETINISQRYRQINGMLPQKIRVLGFVPGIDKYERFLHKKFEKHRLKGEWFEPAQEILDYIKYASVEYEIYPQESCEIPSDVSETNSDSPYYVDKTTW